MRGPGKKKSGTKNLESRTSLLETQLQRTDALGGGKRNPSNDARPFEQSRAIPQTASEVESGTVDNPIALEARLRRIYPVFLHPENTMGALEDLKRAARDDQKSAEGFTSLVSQDLIRYMLENTYDEINKLCPIFDLSAVQGLNTEQQAISSLRPAGNAARWAILNTWTALALHLKTVTESEAEFNLVIKSYHHNAVLVLPELILQPACTDTIQALLLMATFADSTEDHRSFVMLLTNAARQLELICQTLSGVLDRVERETIQRLLTFAHLQEKKLVGKYGLASILNETM